jgi:hypothetical protein
VNLSDLAALGASWKKTIAGFPATALQASAVPEPGTLALLAAAGMGLAGLVIRKRKLLTPVSNLLENATMKRLLLMVCVVLVTAGTLCAEVQVPYKWTKESASSGLDRLILTVMPSGVTVSGFDIMVYDSLFRGVFVTGGDPIFKAGKDLDTSFLLNTKHGTFPQPTVDDLVVASASESAAHIYGGFAVTGGGAYAAGWSSPLDLLEILVPTGSVTPSDLIVTTVDAEGIPTGGGAVCETNQGPGVLVPIPEPGTLALLAGGLVGLIAYAWRKRK